MPIEIKAAIELPALVSFEQVRSAILEQGYQSTYFYDSGDPVNFLFYMDLECYPHVVLVFSAYELAPHTVPASQWADSNFDKPDGQYILVLNKDEIHITVEIGKE